MPWSGSPPPSSRGRRNQCVVSHVPKRRVSNHPPLNTSGAPALGERQPSDGLRCCPFFQQQPNVFFPHSMVFPIRQSFYCSPPRRRCRPRPPRRGDAPSGRVRPREIERIRLSMNVCNAAKTTAMARTPPVYQKRAKRRCLLGTAGVCNKRAENMTVVMP